MQYFIYSNTIGIKDDNNIFLAYNLQCNDDVGCCFLCHVLFVFFVYVNLAKYKCFVQKWPNCSLTANFPTGFDISKKIMEARGYELTSEFCCNKNAFQ